MKVLLVGGGGREHAIAWKLASDSAELELIAAPGNPGIAHLGRCHAIEATDVRRLVALAEREGVALTIVGPEAPLAAGLVDAFRERRLPVFGPTAAAAEIETSKSFAKRLMLDAGIPTARAERHTDPNRAKSAARRFGVPVVIKASGLAAGKGVVICGSMERADEAIDRMLVEHGFGAAGDEILVEEFMEGEELSCFAFTDGENFLSMLPAQDHKRLGEGDSGPNTGGMGAYAPVSCAHASLIDRIESEILEPTLAVLREHGRPFSGVLYAGLMLTADGPRVVEFNCRFGDPEAQVLLPLLETDLLEPIQAVASGDGLSGASPFRWRMESAVTTVIAAHGYPDAPRVGDAVVLPEPEPDTTIFHAGTSLTEAGQLISAGGRVLSVTAVAPSLAEAQERSARVAEHVGLEGAQFRRDIGWRELQRQSGAIR